MPEWWSWWSFWYGVMVLWSVEVIVFVLVVWRLDREIEAHVDFHNETTRHEEEPWLRPARRDALALSPRAVRRHRPPGEALPRNLDAAVQDPAFVLREIARFTGPGGRLYLYVDMRPEAKRNLLHPSPMTAERVLRLLEGEWNLIMEHPYKIDPVKGSYPGPYVICRRRT